MTSRTSRISAAIGASIVAPIVDVLDVDGVVQRINLEDALSRVDLDALLSRVDINALLDRVDLNRHLLRVDLDRVLERSNISAIVARNSSGVFGIALDGARAQIFKADLAYQRLGRCACCRKEPWELPPLPGGGDASLHRPLDPEDPAVSTPSHPNRSLRLAQEAQGRYAGILARFIANAIDFILVMTVFTIFLVLAETFINRIFPNKQKDFDSLRDWVGYPVFLYLWKLIYEAGSLAATGRTIGLALLGLRVVKSSNGMRVGPLQALWRTAVEPFCLITVVGSLIGWVRRDGRQLHDLLACTGVCYSWDAKLAYLRQRAFDEMDEKQSV
eukprot:CAMPEP_0181134478 /NCGR_PEP_ID=MMETSP1071-20121207/32110_1 /TAXON_ID=35127 /ORGANISM="Thalassiosira sp., Strain NH16" /LENGTH=329 /DNA_ID=CAMNT_0023221001 /DNA_START=20 /DNA_END=1009 /DNA_ORIENTATION=+